MTNSDVDKSLLPTVTANFPIESSITQSVRNYAIQVAEAFDLDISALERISIAENFKMFTSAFETGFGSTDRPDVSDLAVGFTPEILRDGQLKSHVILPKAVIDSFASSDSKRIGYARYTIAHELAHADEHCRSSKRFAEVIVELHNHPDAFQVGRRAIWSEYYVCRKTARVLPSMITEMEEVLARAAEEFGLDCSTARARLRATRDPSRVRADLCSCAFRFFIASARVLGHLDGLESLFEDECKIAKVYLEDRHLTGSVRELGHTLRSLWNTFPNWSSFDDLQPIIVIIDTLLKKI